MTVEAFLTRELQVRFIDARTLATEAKLNLGVNGYPSEDQYQSIIDEALNIFQQRPDDVQAGMRRLSASLDAVKMPKGSLSSKKMNMEDSCHTRTSESSVSSDGSERRSFKFWPNRRR